LLYGGASLLGAQAVAVLAAGVYAFVLTFVLAKVLDKVFGLAVDPRAEEVGLDISEHGERAYA
jgi:Amt family ammonium transporter